MDAVLLTLEISAQDDRLLLREVLGLLQQAEVVDEVAVAGGLLLHGRHRRGRVGVARVDELRPGQGPSARPRPRQGLKIRVDLHQVWLLGRFRHGREVTEQSVTMSRKSDEPVAPLKRQLRLSNVRAHAINVSGKNRAPPGRKVCTDSHIPSRYESVLTTIKSVFVKRHVMRRRSCLSVHSVSSRRCVVVIQS